MRIHVLAFAHLRELLHDGAFDLELAPGGTAADAWDELARRHPAIGAMRGSIRLARNGAIVEAGEPLREGDELALLPPAGGG